MKNLWKITFFIISLVSNVAQSEEIKARCLGNIETYDKKIIKAGIEYFIAYEAVDKTAKVSFAGRNITAKAEKGKTYKGVWIQNQDENSYLSFLPLEGGEIKFMFEDKSWFSGNCQ